MPLETEVSEIYLIGRLATVCPAVLGCQSVTPEVEVELTIIAETPPDPLLPGNEVPKITHRIQENKVGNRIHLNAD